MSAYPDNLLYYLKSMQGYSRNNVKVLPLTSTTVDSGQPMQFRLPTNSLIDLSTWTLHGTRKLENTNKTGGGRCMFGKDTASMIRSLQIQIGGQTIQNLDNYNVVWQALKDQTMSPAAEECMGYLEGAYKNVKIPSNTDDSKAAPFIIRNWLGFFQASPSILDTSLTGEIVITITWDQDRRNWAVGNSDAANCTFKCENLFSTVDLISIQDGVYEQVARQALESGMMLEIPVPSYYKFDSFNESNNYTTRFTIGCQSLDAAMILQRLSKRGFDDPVLHDFANTGNPAVTVTNNSSKLDGTQITDNVKLNIAKLIAGVTVTSVDGSGNGTLAAVPSHSFINLTTDVGGAIPDLDVDLHAKGDAIMGSAHKHIQSGLQFNGSAASDEPGNGWYFEVNGAHVPSHRVRRSDTLHYNKIAFGVHGTDHGNLMATALSIRDDNATHLSAHNNEELEEVMSTQFIPVMRFNHASSDKRLLSGIDCRSNPVQLSFTANASHVGSDELLQPSEAGRPCLKHTAAYETAATSSATNKKATLASGLDVMVVALCTSTLMLGAGQQLSFSA